MVQVGLIWALAGAWRRYPSGRAPLALVLQQPPLLPCTFCNHGSLQCVYLRSCNTSMMRERFRKPHTQVHSHSYAGLHKVLAAFALQMPFWSVVRFQLYM
jgi:hypothetical protein